MFTFYKHKETGKVISKSCLHKIQADHHSEFELHPGPATHTMEAVHPDDSDFMGSEFNVSYAMAEIAMDVINDLGSSSSSDLAFGGGDFGGAGSGGDF
jgi:hypothetical protein